jgi:hypothetical protein
VSENQFLSGRNSTVLFLVFGLLGLAHASSAFGAAAGNDAPGRRLAEYRGELRAFRQEFRSVRSLPSVDFFLFGMGPRSKLLYKSGALVDAVTGQTIRQWQLQSEVIVSVTAAPSSASLIRDVE